MHDIRFIEENFEFAEKNLKTRGVSSADLRALLLLNQKRKALLLEIEGTRAEIKRISHDVGEQQKLGHGEEANVLKKAVSKKKEGLKLNEGQLAETLSLLDDALSKIPNFIHPDVPEGDSEAQNLEVERVGRIPEFDFVPKDHHELGEALGLIDFDTPGKIVGTRFSILMGELAKLERALSNFMLDTHISTGHLEVAPPYIVNAKNMFGTGQLPKFAEDSFKLEGLDWYLIPTAEVPLTNLRRDELFSYTELPLKYCAATPCFRSEAGSYGRDTRGLIRQHQFNKVEIVYICEGKDAQKLHEELLSSAKSILNLLELPYRVVLLSSGDTSFSAHKCYDLEVWLPGQKAYREISSVSHFSDFQARRAKIRYRDDSGWPQFAHTLNGSGLAVGRTLLAVMENYQNADGSITIPQALLPYMSGIKKLNARA